MRAMTRYSILCALLSFTELAVAQGEGRCTPAPAGLISRLSFEEPQFRGPSSRPGMVGLGLHLDGKQQYFVVPSEGRNWQVGRGDFTVELWVKVESPDRTQNIADKRDNQPHGYLIYTSQGHAGFQVTHDGEALDVKDPERTLADGKWHHLAGVATRLPAQPLALYVDGKLRGKSSRNTPLGNLDSAATLWLGRHHANRIIDRENIYFEGGMDELAVYRRALAAGEVQAIYRAGRFGKCTPAKH